jgi:predicted short-subunit dehydrogenase-like oxidoreductase (DUF2520 family)
LAIVGAGRVGRALGRRLRELGWEIGVVVTRSEASSRRAVRFIGTGKPRGGMTRHLLGSRVILIAVPDDAICNIAGELARMGGEELRGKIVLHTSGAQDSRALRPAKEYGAAVGSMHPLQTFSGVGVPPLDGKVFAVEGDFIAVRAAWTGPLARGDYKIVGAHVRALRDSQEETARAYEALNRLAARVLAQDAAAVNAELEKISAGLSPKVKVRGGCG